MNVSIVISNIIPGLIMGKIVLFSFFFFGWGGVWERGTVLFNTASYNAFIPNPKLALLI